MTDALALALSRVAGHLEPGRAEVVEAWVAALRDMLPEGETEADLLDSCARRAETLFGRMARGEVEQILGHDTIAATDALRLGESLQGLADAIRVFGRACLPRLLQACPDRGVLAEALLAVEELGHRRLEALLHACEDEAARRIVEAEEQTALAVERAREVSRKNDQLSKSESRSRQHAAQISLLDSVARRIAGLLDPDRLMQEAAESIQTRLDYTYVAVVVLDNEGVLVGRWAGRAGVGRQSRGRAQGPPGGVIGRAIRARAPQLVDDVTRDPDYQADVPGTRSEMVIPLLEEGIALGAIDFQSMDVRGFDLDDVAAAEALAEFLIVALRNARLFAESRKPGAS